LSGNRNLTRKTTAGIYRSNMNYLIYGANNWSVCECLDERNFTLFLIWERGLVIQFVKETAAIVEENEMLGRFCVYGSLACRNGFGPKQSRRSNTYAAGAWLKGRQTQGRF